MQLRNWLPHHLWHILWSGSEWQAAPPLRGGDSTRELLSRVIWESTRRVASRGGGVGETECQVNSGTLDRGQEEVQSVMMNSLWYLLICKASRWSCVVELWIHTFETGWREMWIYWSFCLWDWEWVGSVRTNRTGGGQDRNSGEQWGFLTWETWRQEGRGEARMVCGEWAGAGLSHWGRECM